MDSILEKLRLSGYKITHPRKVIIELLEESQGVNLDAKEIFERLKKNGHEIDHATVYRVLELLYGLGVVHKSNFSQQHAHFGLKSVCEMHVICRRCGKIEERALDVKEVEKITGDAPDGFTVQDISLEIYGLCRECKKTT